MRRHPSAKRKKEPNLPYALALGSGINVLFTLLVMLLLTRIAYATKDPTATVVPMAWILLFLTSCSAGFIAEKCYGRAGATTGLLAGLIYVVLLVLLSFVVSSDGSETFWMRICSYAFALLMSVAGGTIACQKPKKRHKPHPMRSR